MDSLFDLVTALQKMLVERATDGTGNENEFARLRKIVLSNRTLDLVTPSFLRECRTLGQFWDFIRPKFPTYQERRSYLREQFNPMLELLERGGPAPSDGLVTGALKHFDSAHVQAAWAKALERRTSDPEGAITAARTLIESVCKYILDEAAVPYADADDLPKLYKQTSTTLKLAPSQHTEEVFKQILSGCISVVAGLASLRNRLGDAHGKGRVGSKPAARHAELAVNLSGTLASYLLATWEVCSESANIDKNLNGDN